MSYKTEEIEEKIVDALSFLDVPVIRAKDFSEVREDTMVIVRISQVEQMNVTLPDYRMTLHIILNSYINGDEKTEKYNEIAEQIHDALDPYLIGSSLPSTIFGNIPVVGWLAGPTNYTTDSQSNTMTIESDLILSYTY